MRTRMLRVLIPILAAGLLLCIVIALGQAARQRLRQDEHYSLHFVDIDCPAPPGQRRENFLPEVQYLGQLPNALPALDDDTPTKLAAAFARHPWVEKVEQVRLVPPDRAEVRLLFRTPVLAVPQRNGRRVVDGHGILLPASAPSDELPVLHGRAAPPPNNSGSAWDDATVRTAAAVAAYLRPYRERLGLTACEVRDGSVELTCSTGRVVWGSAPGAEIAGEESAAAKLRRLLSSTEARETPVPNP